MKKITKIEVVVESGLGKVPPEIRERILTKVQARAFLRGYIQLHQEIEDHSTEEAEQQNAGFAVGVAQARLHELS